MPRATVQTTTKQQVTIAPRVQQKLKTELHGYAAIHREIKALNDAKQGHADYVFVLANEHVDADKFELEGFKVAVQRGKKTRSLNIDKLTKRVVKDGKYSVKAFQAVLEDCADEKDKKDHVRISIPGEDKNDAE